MDDGMMNQYYRTWESVRGWICTLTNVYCDKDCRGCVFAKVAFKEEMKRRRKLE